MESPTINVVEEKRGQGEAKAEEHIESKVLLCMLPCQGEAQD